MEHPAPPVAAYDVEAVRKDFPILSRTVYGKPLVYLDNGASRRSRNSSSTPLPMPIPTNTPTSIAACISCRMPRRSL